LQLNLACGDLFLCSLLPELRDEYSRILNICVTGCSRPVPLV
jgi:hypothetical protein